MQLKAHKNVLCASFRWFLKKYNRVSKLIVSPEDATTTMVSDTKQCFTAMMEFLYRFEYDEPTESPMIFHISMFAVGEKYLIPSLQAFAALRFQNSTTTNWSIGDFTMAIRRIFEGTSESFRLLKTMAVGCSAEHEAELFGDSVDTSFQSMAAGMPDYTSDGLRETNKRMREHKAIRKFRCLSMTGCGHKSPGGCFVVNRPVP